MKSLSIDVAAAEISRLALLRGFPADNATAMKALIELLQKWFVGATRRTYAEGDYSRATKEDVSPDEQLHCVIDAALERCSGWQSPTQLKEILEDMYPFFNGERIAA